MRVALVYPQIALFVARLSKRPQIALRSSDYVTQKFAPWAPNHEADIEVLELHYC